LSKGWWLRIGMPGGDFATSKRTPWSPPLPNPSPRCAGHFAEDCQEGDNSKRDRRDEARVCLSPPFSARIENDGADTPNLFESPTHRARSMPRRFSPMHRAFPDWDSIQGVPTPVALHRAPAPQDRRRASPPPRDRRTGRLPAPLRPAPTPAPRPREPSKKRSRKRRRPARPPPAPEGSLPTPWVACKPPEVHSKPPPQRVTSQISIRLIFECSWKYFAPLSIAIGPPERSSPPKGWTVMRCATGGRLAPDGVAAAAAAAVRGVPRVPPPPPPRPAAAPPPADPGTAAGIGGGDTVWAPRPLVGACSSADLLFPLSVPSASG